MSLLIVRSNNMKDNGKGKTRRLRDLKFIVATRMLDHIGVSMYSRYQKAIGELVVNGYDADANYVVVNVKTGEDKITIEDNGDGMNEQDIREGYMFLGSGQKRATKRTRVFHRLPIGNKGIGKLAGFGIARRMEVKTVKDGKALEFCLDRQELEGAERMGRLSEPILDRASIKLNEFEAKGKSNGTVVVLSKLRLESGRIDIDKVRAHIAQELPIGKDFKVLVNSQVCEPRHIPASRRISVNHRDPVFGHIVGEIIIAKRMLPQPGILTKVRNRVVGEPQLFGISTTSFTYHVADLVIGSVEVASFDPEEETNGISVITTDRESFVETHPKYIAYSKFMNELLTRICREEEKKRHEKKEEEKKAKVDEALKQVAEDFNAYDDLLKRQAREVSKTQGTEDKNGTKAMKPDLNIDTKSKLKRHRSHTPIPPDIMKEIKASIGHGRLRFRNQTYKIERRALGSDWPESDIRPEESLILVNLDHPTYEQGIRENCIEIIIFRAIAACFARNECESSDEMFEHLDRMVRFHASRTKKRKTKSTETQQEIILIGS